MPNDGNALHHVRSTICFLHLPLNGVEHIIFLFLSWGREVNHATLFFLDLRAGILVLSVVLRHFEVNDEVNLLHRWQWLWVASVQGD